MDSSVIEFLNLWQIRDFSTLPKIIESFSIEKLKRITGSLNDAYQAITDAISFSAEGDLHLEEFVAIKRAISEMVQVCEDIKDAKVRTLENKVIDDETKIMNDLHKYLRNLDQQSCKAFYKSLENALIPISREIHNAEGRGFEFVGQLTVAANIIEDALNVAEAFTDEK